MRKCNKRSINSRGLGFLGSWLFQATLFFFLLFTVHAKAEISSVSELNSDPDFHQKIENLWSDLQPVLTQYIEKADTNPYTLYNVQIYTHSFMKYAFKNKNIALIDDLLSLYSIAANKMNNTDQYLYYFFENRGRQSQHTLDKYYKMWTTRVNNNKQDLEVILYSAQFLGLISDAVAEISRLDATERSSVMNDFVQTFVPLLDSHYKRWVVGLEVEGVKDVGPFQYRGFGCKSNGVDVPTLLTHLEAVDLLLEKKTGDNFSYCNLITDVDLWIISGVSNYLAAYANDASLMDKPSDLAVLQDYLQKADTLLASRKTVTHLTDFAGNKTEGLIFDQGVWDQHINFAYAGYTATIFPTVTNKSSRKNIGWDISHGRRFLFVFESLYKNKKVLGLSFPRYSDMNKFANQFIFGFFNKDFKRPLFANFMDGSDGWYKVKGTTGYPPSSSTYAILSGGFGFYQHYNQQVDKVMTALYNTIHDTNSETRQFVIDQYEHYYWVNKKPTRRLNFANPNSTTKFSLLEFYSSLSLTDDTLVEEDTSEDEEKVVVTSTPTTEVSTPETSSLPEDVTVEPAPQPSAPLLRPLAAFSASATTVNKGGSINFVDESTNSPAAWSWLFLGGSPISSKVQNPTVIYNKPGVYKVILVVKNADGKGDSEVKESFITVLEEETEALVPAPIADFSANITTITQGERVSFTDQSSNSPTEWQWTFAGGSPASSTQENPTITYNTSGVYQVQLTVKNDEGKSDQAIKTGFITVLAKPTISAPPLRPKANFSASATTVKKGESIQFTDTSSNSPAAWTWLFLGGKPISSKQQHPLVTYDKPGTYKVLLVVKNTDGKGDSEVRENFITVTE